jgi:ankyrin repeat protein
MRIMLEGGADPLLTQTNKRTPIMLAAGLHPQPADNNPLSGSEASVREAITICLDRGVDINAANDAGETAIYAAIGSPPTIRFLVEKGAQLDVKNNKGQTPLDSASQGHDPGDESVALLRELSGAAARTR